MNKLLCITSLGLLLLTGCHQAHVTEPMPKEVMANDPDAQIEFWHRLTDQPVCSNDEAFHGLLLYLDNQDTATSFEERVQILKSRKLLLSNFNQPADAAIQRGTLAVALCQALKIKGGVTMRVLGPSDRYASRELQFMGLFPPGSPQQTFSGNEYVGIIGRIEDYQRGNAADKPASEMQGHDTGQPATQPNNAG